MRSRGVVKDWRVILATAIAAKAETQALADNYGSYVEDVMKHDEAMERALKLCLTELHE